MSTIRKRRHPSRAAPELTSRDDGIRRAGQLPARGALLQHGIRSVRRTLCGDGVHRPHERCPTAFPGYTRESQASDQAPFEAAEDLTRHRLRVIPHRADSATGYPELAPQEPISASGPPEDARPERDGEPIRVEGRRPVPEARHWQASVPARLVDGVGRPGNLPTAGGQR